jgi:hypothetical protein
MPLFTSSDASKYFDQALFPRFRAQSMKEDMWAAQYFAIRDQARNPMKITGNSPADLAKLPTFAIMTYNSGYDDASNEFYREQKIGEATRIAQGNLTKPVIWCTEPSCSLSFPVTRAAWTAGVLASLGI